MNRNSGPDEPGQRIKTRAAEIQQRVLCFQLNPAGEGFRLGSIDQ